MVRIRDGHRIDLGRSSDSVEYSLSEVNMTSWTIINAFLRVSVGAGGI